MGSCSVDVLGVLGVLGCSVGGVGVEARGDNTDKVGAVDGREHHGGVA